ncbi:hypothetical protein SAMN05444166_0113 [Singulisphaera sp. GP187]|nr:hypothetical protein SAMN05444166_0113 [Singulisphaera sp. GP187]
MILHRLHPTNDISIFPPRDAKADSLTSLDRLRARFARDDGLPFADGQKKGDIAIYACSFRGRPRGRKHDSSPSRIAVSRVHDSPP